MSVASRGDLTFTAWATRQPVAEADRTDEPAVEVVPQEAGVEDPVSWGLGVGTQEPIRNLRK